MTDYWARVTEARYMVEAARDLRPGVKIRIPVRGVSDVAAVTVDTSAANGRPAWREIGFSPKARPRRIDRDAAAYILEIATNRPAVAKGRRAIDAAATYA